MAEENWINAVIRNVKEQEIEVPESIVGQMEELLAGQLSEKPLTRSGLIDLSNNLIQCILSEKLEEQEHK